MERLELSRREFIGSVGISSLAGCLDFTPLSSATGVQLGTLFFQNSSGEPQSIQFKIFRNGEIVHEDGLELSDGEKDSIHPTWSTDPAEYRILYATATDLGEVSIPDDYSQVSESGCSHPRFYFSPVRDFTIEMFRSSENDDDDFEGTC